MRNAAVVVPAVLMLVSGAAGLAFADESDHERARKALQAGEIRPLKDIVGTLQRRCGGRVIEVELEERSLNGRRTWLYELRMMMPKGDVLGLAVDAATTEVLDVKGAGASSACR